MSQRHRWRSSWVLGLTMACLGFSGCGEATPEVKPPAKTDTPAPTKTADAPKAKGKGKSQDPTADMERDELRAYRKQKREGG